MSPESQSAQITPETEAEARRRGASRLVARWAGYDDLGPELAERGWTVRDTRVDVEGFRRWVDRMGYRSLPYWDYGRWPTATEKWLEHYVATELVQPRSGEVLVDVASCTSPYPDLLREHYGLVTYRQDLLYPPGVEGDRIGGDAAAMPVADGFADILTLHCSFEHFEGDADRKLIEESARVLRPGGRLCILPLYTSREYLIQSDPATWGDRYARFEPEAAVYLAAGWGELHGRFYDLSRLEERVLKPASRHFEVVLHRIVNLDEVGESCYLRLAAVFVRR